MMYPRSKPAYECSCHPSHHRPALRLHAEMLAVRGTHSEGQPDHPSTLKTTIIDKTPAIPAPLAAVTPDEQQEKATHAAAPSDPPIAALFEAVRSVDGFPPGLRGLNNMGNTCFMNSVLQALLHAPLLRSHYLLHRHYRHACDVTAGGGYCVSCEMDDVFSAAHNGDRAPYSPSAFLHAWWMLAGSMLGRYQQQDAHEFFLFILEMLTAAGPRAPDSIASKVFSGTLRSDVVCGCCGHTSTTIDPFTNLSLDVPPPQTILPPPIVPRPTTLHGNGKAANGAGPAAKAAAKAAAAAAKKASAKGGRLVGAALSSHLARMKRESGGSGDPSHHTDPSISDPGLEDSLSHEPGGSGSGHTPRRSPPLPYSGSRVPAEGGLAPDPTLVTETSHLEAASVAGHSSGEGAGVLDEAARDTLSSPQRLPELHVEIGPGGGTAQHAQHASVAAAALTSPAAVLQQYPQLAGYYKWPGASLLGCLRRFVREETLGDNERWRCEQCASDGAHAVKQLSLQDLPPFAGAACQEV